MLWCGQIPIVNVFLSALAELCRLYHSRPRQWPCLPSHSQDLSTPPFFACLSKAARCHGYHTGKQHADALKDAYQSHYGAVGREWIKYLANHQQEAIEVVRAAEERWRLLVPSDYGEQVHRVAARFAVLEAALIFGALSLDG